MKNFLTGFVQLGVSAHLQQEPGFAVTMVVAFVLAAFFIFSARSSSDAAVCVML
jgi:hypothetical protein